MSEAKKVQYALVAVTGGCNYTFTKWHLSLADATEEAERLTRKERKSFLILKLIGISEPVDVPVKISLFDPKEKKEK